MTVLWETSKEHHSRFGFFQECSSPQGGSSVKSLLAFVKTLCKLGKQIEVRKSNEKDKKAKNTSQTSQGEKIFLYPYRLKNYIRHLWKFSLWTLNTYVPICLYLVSLQIPSLGSEIPGVLSIHTKLWVFTGISTRKKSNEKEITPHEL